MLPEDRIREDKVIAGEHAKRTHLKGLKKNKGGHTTVLINRLRTAIESRAPKGLTARAVLRRQFSLLDSDKSGAVDLKEFCSVIKRYLNGAEQDDLTKLFRTFDTDGNGTVSVEEFTDKLLKEAGPHNYCHKQYTRIKPPRPEDEPAPPPSSRPRSGQRSEWTVAVKRQAGKTLTTVPSRRADSSSAQSDRTAGQSDRSARRKSRVTNHIVDDATPSMGGRPASSSSSSSFRQGNSSARAPSSVASSSDLGSRAHSLRWAHRHTDTYKDTGTQPLTKNAVEQHMTMLMVQEATVRFLGQFRRSVRRSSGKEISGSSDKTKSRPSKVGASSLTERVLTGDTKAANTLVWTMSEFAKQSSSGDKTRLSQKRFEAALNIFRGGNPPVDVPVSRLLWAASGKGKISNFVQRCFPTVHVD